MFFHNEAGKVLKLVGTSIDITERKQVEAELRASLTEKDTLLKEIHHRVKNNLQIVSSLLSLQSCSLQDPKLLQPFVESQRRIAVMAMIHEGLYRSGNLATLNFTTYVQNLIEDLFQSYLSSDSGICWHLAIDQVNLALDQAIPCGLIINELVSNAIKYAFPDDRPGHITIRFVRDSLQYQLTVTDNGIGLPVELDPFHTDSLGLQVVCALTKQLDGSLEIGRTPGATFCITFPTSD
jgi:two-component sensor histidine kinase